ncbi:MAG: FAD:protein FMN transferase [Propioniciclava sp.]|uniref:FAD:protein FMN transferase n=1 Tax=Propioniciclava sp. TaxID=2038686 RepID=UPI0039E31720
MNHAPGAPDAVPDPAGEASSRQAHWSDSTAMGTTVHVCVVGDAATDARADAFAGAAQDAHTTIADLDAALSRFCPASDVSRLNAAPGAWIPVGPHLVAVARAAEHYRALTRGAFDATLPAAAGAGPRIRWRATASGGWEAWLAPGHLIDFGAIAKGYAADLARDRCRERAAGVLVSVGTSSIAMAGTPPHRDAWRIALSSPWQAVTETLGYVEASAGSFSLSGVRGVRISSAPLIARHVTEPRTGRPASTDVCSVGVLGDDGMRSEALSTACLVLGLQRGLALCRAQAVDAVFCTVDGRILATPGLAPRISLRAGMQKKLEHLR